MPRAAVVAALVLASTGGAAPAWAREPSTTVRVQPAAGSDPPRLTVRLEGWPPATVTIAVCTDRPDGGCAFPTAVQAGIGADGSASATLPAVAPPTGCPCVVRVRALSGVPTQTAAVALTATPAAARPAADAPRPLAITRVTVHGGWQWAALFGGPARREAAVTVRNTAPVAVTGSTVTVTAGRGEHPTGMVAPPELGTLAPGEERTLRVPVTLPAPAAGTYTVHGEIDPYGPLGPAGATVVFHAETTAQPWGLTAVPAAALMVVALRQIRKRPGSGSVSLPTVAAP
ncbi:hypothetical protein [Dactylosporangium sp. CA-233914]|uniref:hypothetical protein n=1 Tax=Dactylosporangium sp. CA-233914 TaxID=3239934 RepID=UPI003D91A97F